MKGKGMPNLDPEEARDDLNYFEIGLLKWMRILPKRGTMNGHGESKGKGKITET